ncbi:MAG: VCBS repeat-containing protein [Saprospiraceae bacterium]|nr:VCBS repeat-containing protein [Saprospiraceae bacterium]
MLLHRLPSVCLALLCYTTPVFTQSGTVASAVEICDNQVDDDNDNLIDCYDPDCQCFTGEDCSVTELPSDFKARLAWQSTQNSASVTAIPVVANMNPQQDSLPEIIVAAASPSGGTTPNKILFFRGDGSNANAPMSLTIPGGFNAYPVPGPTIGDIDNDGKPELIMSCNDSRIRVFRNYSEANPLAPMTLWITSPVALDFQDQKPYLADFNGDGTPEIYAGSDIFQFNLSNPAAPSLNKVISGPAYIGQAIYSSYLEGSCSPTAVDILSVTDCGGDPDCAGLELVAGPVIYSIDLNPSDGDGFQIKIKRDLNQMAPNSAYADGYTAVADADLDGVLDVVVSAKRGNNIMGVYVWNKNGLLRFFPYPNPNLRSGSLACIANLYDDRTAGFSTDMPEIVVCNAYNLNCFNLQAALLNPGTPYWWSLDTEDFSGFTGSSVYDFNGDGIFELVYRDEDNFRILYGGAAPFPAGVDAERNWFKIACGSLTSDEYPVVADVDNDGETESAVTGYTYSGYNTPSSDYRGRLRVFKSDADPWVPCRNVWNQYNYFVVNVNDDLSIPKQQQLHYLELPAAGSGNRPLNRYLSQRQLLDEQFQPFFPLPDALATTKEVACTANDLLTVEVEICNAGSNTLKTGTPVAFYQSDPTSTNALLLGTAQLTGKPVERDSCGLFVFTLPRATGKIFGVVNDDGSHARPFDLSTDFPVTTQYECNWINNIFQFEPTYPALSIDTVNGSCTGQPGRAMATALSLHAPVTYQWSNGMAGPDISGVADGLYAVTATDARGCTIADTTWVSAGASLEAETAIAPIPCTGQTGGVSVNILSATPPVAFLWSNSATTPLLQDLGPGTYTVTVSFAAGKCTQVFDVSLTEPSLLLTLGTAATPACPGASNGSVSFGGATQGTPPYSLLWSSGDTAYTLDSLPAAAYSLTLTDANGCSFVETVEVPAYEAPVLQTTVSNVSCAGAQNGSLLASISGGTPGVSLLWSNEVTTADNPGLGPGMYTLTLTYADGACALDLAAEITEPLPLLSAGVATTTACPGEANGGAAFLGAAQGTAPYALQWSTGSTATEQTGLVSAEYSLTLTDAQGCSLVEFVSVPAYEAPAPAPTTTDVTCFGAANGQVTVSLAGGTPGFAYAWSNGATTPELNNLSPGTYTLSLSFANGACTETLAVQIDEPLALQSAGIAVTNTCSGQPNGALSFLGAAQGTPPYALSWSDGSSSNTLSGLPPGAYSLTLTDAQGCSLLETALVQAHPLPAFAASVDNPRCFDAADGQILLQPVGGTAPFAFAWNTGQTTENLTGLPAGTYALTISDAQGCTQQLSWALSEPPLLLSNGTSAIPACPGEANGAAAFAGASQGTPPYSLLWSTGSAAPELADLPAGTYGLTVTDAQGCTLLESVEVPVHPATVLAALPQEPPCFGSASGSIDLTVSGGTAPFQFEWSNGQASEDLATLSAGTYGVTVTGVSGCTQALSVLLTQPDSLSLQTLVQAEHCETADGGLSVTATGGTAPYAYGWSTGGFSASLSGLPAGAYALTLTDARGCTAIRHLTVPAQGLVPELTAFTDTITCAQPLAHIGVSGDQSNLNFTWTGPAATLSQQAQQTVPAAGAYAVTATNGFGCTVTAVLAVAEDRAPPVAEAGAATVEVPCGIPSVLLDAGGSSAGAGFLNQWSRLDAGVVVWDTVALLMAATQPGWYRHTVRNLRNGCTASDSVAVRWAMPIQAAVGVDSISCFGENDGTIRLTGLSGGSPPLLYSIGGTPFSSQNLAYGLGPGVYPVQIRDGNGCLWASEVRLLEPAELSVRLLAGDTVIELGQFVKLEARPSPPGVALSGMVWQPQGFDFVPMSLRQQVWPKDSTVFTVTIYDEHGCPATDRVSVRVDNFQIYVPNVIFPGRDFNDAFTIFAGDGVLEIRLMRIYDRWGSHVFEKRHFPANDLSEGWDGTYRSEPVNPGVFVWYAEVLLRDGQVRLLKGDVTVLR